MDHRAKKKKLNNFKEKDEKAPVRATRTQAARIHRKFPRQVRSKAMVEAILKAAAEVFAELGYSRTTTDKIAERAGVSVGSLYQYFPNKGGLIASLYNDHQTKVHAVARNAIQRFSDHSITLEEVLRRYLNELDQVHEANPTVIKALERDVICESKVNTGEDELEELDRLARLLAKRPDVRDGDAAVISAIMEQAIGHLSLWVLHDTPSHLNHATLREETIQLLLRYLKK